MYFQVKFTDQSLQKSDEALIIGEDAMQMLEDQEGNRLRKERVKEFYSNVREYFQDVCDYLIKKLPLQETLLSDVQIIDPAKQMDLDASSLLRLLKRFPALLPPDASRNTLMEEFARYQMADIDKYRYKPSTQKGEKSLERVDRVWALIVEKEELPVLGKVVTGIMTIPHSSAACERVFSCVRKIDTDQRDVGEDVLEALLVIKSRPAGLTNTVDSYTKEEMGQMKSAYYNSLKKYRP